MTKSSGNWLRDVTIISEGKSFYESNNIDIFRSLGDACRKLEPWYVREYTFFAMNGEGHPINFFVIDGNITAKILEDEPQDLKTLKNWLIESAKHISTVRKYKAGKGKLILGKLESTGVLPTSIEGLIAYNHFTD